MTRMNYELFLAALIGAFTSSANIVPTEPSLPVECGSGNATIDGHILYSAINDFCGQFVHSYNDQAVDQLQQVEIVAPIHLLTGKTQREEPRQFVGVFQHLTMKDGDSRQPIWIGVTSRRNCTGSSSKFPRPENATNDTDEEWRKYCVNKFHLLFNSECQKGEPETDVSGGTVTDFCSQYFVSLDSIDPHIRLWAEDEAGSSLNCHPRSKLTKTVRGINYSDCLCYYGYDSGSADAFWVADNCAASAKARRQSDFVSAEAWNAVIERGIRWLGSGVDGSFTKPFMEDPREPSPPWTN